MKTYEFANRDKMPAFGLGTWKSKPGEVYAAVRHAIKTGYRHIDCAAAYGNEAEIGKAFTDAFREGDVTRDELWVTSKLWNNAHLKEDVRPALEQTLKDLNLDHLDLYLMHWPIALKPGVGFPASGDDFLSPEEIPVAVTWAAMEECLAAGLTKHIGVSNFSIKKLKALNATSNIKVEVNQVELHPFLQQNSMLDFCQKENIVLTAYSPLGSSDRPAAFKAPNEPSLLENKSIMEIAKANDCSTAQILISWAIQRGTSVIPKSVNLDRIEQNFQATSIMLCEADIKKIARLDMHARYVLGEFWALPGSGYSIETLWDE